MSLRERLLGPPAGSTIIRRRVLLGLGVLLLLCAALVARLALLQIVQHDRYATLSRDNRVKVVPTAPLRGKIYSRDGLLLADNQPVFNLEVELDELRADRDRIEELATVVGLSDDDRDAVAAQLQQRPRPRRIVVKRDLSEAWIARFAANRHRFPGYEVQVGFRRFYPLADIMSHLLGYVGGVSRQELGEGEERREKYRLIGHIGKLGIEKYYEDLLVGEAGYRQVEVNTEGSIIRELAVFPPRPGKTLHLSIDASLQIEAHDALAGHSGAVVAVEPASGQLLALVSVPGYDPNRFVQGLSAEAYRRLRDAEGSPLFNRAVSGTYPPGSTLKPFVALAGLYHGVRVAQQQTWCPGWFKLPNYSRPFRDWKRWGHGLVAMGEALEESCDVYFYNLAMELGVERMVEQLQGFGFGRRTGIDLVGEEAGVLPTRAWIEEQRNGEWHRGDTVILGIGQGYIAVTPLQLAQAAAILAGHGRHMQLNLLHAVVGAAGEERSETAPVQLAGPPATDAQAWHVIEQGMVDVMHGQHGTARRVGAQLNYRMAGKTGTAQVFRYRDEADRKGTGRPRELRDHALFIAYAPVRQPRIAVAVVVEHGGSGSAAAAPIAQRIIDHYLGERGA